jgi:tRNA-guanine family transglycosylase
LVSKRGVWVRSPVTQERFLLSPEKSIEMQFALGTDAMVVLDQCSGPHDNQEKVAEMVAKTTAWANAAKLNLINK